jgi:hypothetical protein
VPDHSAFRKRNRFRRSRRRPLERSGPRSCRLDPLRTQIQSASFRRFISFPPS